MANYMDNQRKPMSKRDKQVEKRNEILGLVDRGCVELNNGNRGFLARVLKVVHNQPHSEFTVDTMPEGKYEFFNVDYTCMDGIILIKEGNLELIMVIKLKEGKCKGEWRAYELNPDYFRYEQELLDEARAEIEADRAMSAYNSGYRPQYEGMDDPRGY